MAAPSDPRPPDAEGESVTPGPGEHGARRTTRATANDSTTPACPIDAAVRKVLVDQTDAELCMATFIVRDQFEAHTLDPIVESYSVDNPNLEYLLSGEAGRDLALVCVPRLPATIAQRAERISMLLMPPHWRSATEYLDARPLVEPTIDELLHRRDRWLGFVRENVRDITATAKADARLPSKPRIRLRELRGCA